MNALWHVSFPAWHFLLRGSVVYLAVLLLLRMGGKRQIGQMGTGEFVAILLISNAVQNAMNGGDNSITGGLILAAVIIFLSFGIDYFTFKSKTLEAMIQGQPRLLIHKGHILTQNLNKEFLTLEELKTILRRQGILHIEDVQEAVLESNGSVSVIRKSEATGKGGSSS
jgi:uncharacterized membrane protein YcaP (DUF421 family)